MRVLPLPHIAGLVILSLLTLVPGCHRFFVPDMPAHKAVPAETQVARFLKENAQLPPYKGVGELHFYSGPEAWSMRGAWLGVPERKFRVETIGLAGQPGARLICDGDACHFIYSENGCYRMVTSREANLRLLAGIDMDVTDLVVLLGGGIPVVAHDAAWMADDAASAGPVLKMSRRFYGEVGRIYFSPDMAQVHKIEVFGFRGLKYRAQIVSVRTVDGYRVPDILEIENERAAFSLRVERAWFDVPYSPEAFVPWVPESNRCD